MIVGVDSEYILRLIWRNRAVIAAGLESDCVVSSADWITNLMSLNSFADIGGIDGSRRFQTIDAVVALAATHFCSDMSARPSRPHDVACSVTTPATIHLATIPFGSLLRYD
jgi:hypothetical protein